MLNTAGLLLAVSIVVGQAPETDSPVYPHLEALECFVGDWEAKATIPDGATASDELGEVAGNQVVLSVSVRWAPGKCAQIANVKYHMQGVAQIMGTAIRAWDQTSEKICEHQFTTHKGIWAGTWKKDGKKWIYEYEGRNLDGKKGTGTRVMTFKNEDCYVVKDTNQTLDGKPQPDIEWRFERK